MCDCADLRERLDQLETRMIHIEAEVDDIQDDIEIRRRPPPGRRKRQPTPDPVPEPVDAS
jgi:hypothetical protein